MPEEGISCRMSEIRQTHSLQVIFNIFLEWIHTVLESEHCNVDVSFEIIFIVMKVNDLHIEGNHIHNLTLASYNNIVVLLVN